MRPVCTKCHRPLKHPTETGMGPVCAKASKVQPVPAHERDLFGYDLDKAFHAARYRVLVHIDSLVAEASMAVRKAGREARARLRLPHPPTWKIRVREAPCQFCGEPFDEGLLGTFGCPNCLAEGFWSGDGL